MSPAAVPDTSAPRPGSSVSGSRRGAQAACVSGTRVWQGLSRGFDNDPDVVSALRRDCLAGPWESACDSERVARGFETVDTSSTGHVFSGHCVRGQARGSRYGGEQAPLGSWLVLCEIQGEKQPLSRLFAQLYGGNRHPAPAPVAGEPALPTDLYERAREGAAASRASADAEIKILQMKTKGRIAQSWSAGEWLSCAAGGEAEGRGR